MAIRLRVIEGLCVALCAARSVEEPGDVYLGDQEHHALTQKFAQDFNSERLWPIPEDAQSNILRARGESNNANREWWDRAYGGR